MLKRFSCMTAVLLITATMLVAGDVAWFADIGFSPDGSVYMFGEYGVTDKSYEAYASIYAVDTAKNDFIASGLFKVAPSSKTAGKNGTTVYKELLASADGFMKANKIPVVPNTTAIYVAEESTPASEQIEFRDFTTSTLENPVTYAVRLTTLLEGSGANALSSFYLVIEKRGANGTVLSRKIGGNPKVQRKGITGYRVARILSDHNGKNLIFVIEKKITGATGISIRYMVETITL